MPVSSEIALTISFLVSDIVWVLLRGAQNLTQIRRSEVNWMRLISGGQDKWWIAITKHDDLPKIAWPHSRSCSLNDRVRQRISQTYAIQVVGNCFQVNSQKYVGKAESKRIFQI